MTFRFSILLFFLLFEILRAYSQWTIYSNNFEGFKDGFDLSTVADWSKNGTGGNMEINETNGLCAHESSVCVDMNSNGWGYAAFPVDFVSGKTYNISVWVKANNNSSAVSLSLYDGSNLVSSSSHPGTNDWVKLSLTHTASSSSVLQIRILKNWGTLSFDDFNILCLDCTPPNPRNYYVSSLGSDLNIGSVTDPWKSLEKLSRQTFNPGDSILFRSGDRFDGHFSLNGSGILNLPIVIASYGNGNKPIISGEVGITEGGDFREAIYILNHEHITITDIEVNNERNFHRPSVDSALSYGIYFHNSGSKPLENITLYNVEISNVYAFKPMLDPDDFNGLEVAGLRFFATRNRNLGSEKNYNNINIHNCYFTNIQRLGVHIKHGGSNAGVGNDSINRNSNIVCRNNHFYKTGGTCILPIRSYNCLIEDNLFDRPGDGSDPRMPNRGSSVWTWHCKNTIIQRNRCLHVRGYLDSHGIHIDHHNDHTYVQYNYMEDCEGGFVEILGGNTNAVYRFNISVNDGWRNNLNWVNSNHTLWVNDKASGGVIDYCDETYIYNNTVFVDSAYSTAIDMDGMNHHIYNNIFYYANGSVMGGKRMVINNNNTPLFMQNNLYAGNVVASFVNLDASPVNQNPLFLNEGVSDPLGYQLNINSPAINSGVAELGPAFPQAGLGIFSNIPVYPNEDYFGNPVDFQSGSINIGADNSKIGPTANVKDNHQDNLSSFEIFPNPNKGYFHLKFRDFVGEYTLSITTIEGRTIYSEKHYSKLVTIALSLKSGLYNVIVDYEGSNRTSKLLMITDY